MSIVTSIHLADRARCVQELARDPAQARLRDEAGTPILHHAVEALQPELVGCCSIMARASPTPIPTARRRFHRVADLRQAQVRGAAAQAAAAQAAFMATLLLDRGADPMPATGMTSRRCIRRCGREIWRWSRCCWRAAPIRTPATSCVDRRRCGVQCPRPVPEGRRAPPP